MQPEASRKHVPRDEHIAKWSWLGDRNRSAPNPKTGFGLLRASKAGSRLASDQFIGLLAEHVPDHCQHSIRYFGLLVPSSKSKTSTAIFVLLKQKRQPPPNVVELAGLNSEGFWKRSALG
jgi:hypothetical protein